MTQQEFAALKPEDKVVVGGEATFVVTETDVQLFSCPHRSIAHRIKTPNGEERNFCWCSYSRRPYVCSPDVGCLPMTIGSGRVIPKELP
jgi:hypothetical protein